MVALYPFKAQIDTELSFSKGDRLEILDRPSWDPEWFKARDRMGQMGLVPSNHLLELSQFEENKKMEKILKEMGKFIQQDSELQLQIGDIEEVVTGNSVISSILRMISYHQYPDSRTTLAEKFPFDVQFLESSRIISFMEDVIKFGAGSVRKERLFVVGHQGSGKTSLVHSVT